MADERPDTQGDIKFIAIRRSVFNAFHSSFESSSFGTETDFLHALLIERTSLGRVHVGQEATEGVLQNSAFD